MFDDKYHQDAYNSSIPFIPCPNCNSPYQYRVAAKVIADQKDQINEQSNENFQCLQCGNMFLKHFQSWRIRKIINY